MKKLILLSVLVIGLFLVSCAPAEEELPGDELFEEEGALAGQAHQAYKSQKRAISKAVTSTEPSAKGSEPWCTTKRVVSCEETGSGVSYTYRTRGRTSERFYSDDCSGRLGNLAVDWSCANNVTVQRCLDACMSTEECREGTCASTSEPLCEEKWICSDDGSGRLYQLEDCSTAEDYGCEFGCEDGECLPEATCGNGIFEPDSGEECEDGNRVSRDGCSESCQVEMPPICGNGVCEPPYENDTRASNYCRSDCV